MTIDAQLASGHAGLRYLVEMEFASATVRLTNWAHPIPWAGHDWLALNAVTSVSPVRQSERTEYAAIDLGLQAANDALLSAVLDNTADYRGRPITIYEAYLDDSLQMVEEPEVVWIGVMDQVRINTGNGEDEEATVILRCEPPGKDKRPVNSLRLNNAQHQQRWPGDTFLSRVEALSGKPVPWLSRRFQEI